MKDENDLRDEFAAAMLQGIYSNQKIHQLFIYRWEDLKNRYPISSHEQYIAQECYKQADAMLRERNRNNH